MGKEKPMNLLIHDYFREEFNSVKDRYEGWDIVSDNGNIHPCIGCFHCWISGNGKCIQKDGYETYQRFPKKSY